MLIHIFHKKSNKIKFMFTFASSAIIPQCCFLVVNDYIKSFQSKPKMESLME